MPSPRKPRRTKAKPTKKRRAIFAKRHTYDDGQSPVEMYLDSFGDDSQRVMRSALDSLADILSDGKVPTDKLAWHQLRAQHVAALRGRMLRLFQPSTTNRYLTALRGVMKAAWRLDLIDHETMERAVDVAPARGKRELKGRAVSADELVALFAACSNDSNEPLGARDAAILALLYGAGLRRAEVADALIENFDKRRGRLRIIGKGNKERDAYLPPGALSSVLAWLEHRGTAGVHLFNRITKAGAVAVDHGISAQLVYHVVRHRHLKAGVEPFTPHDLRRSHISDLLDSGVDLATVSRQVGHSNVQTTARYDRRDGAAQQRGVLKLEVPFPK